MVVSAAPLFKGFEHVTKNVLMRVGLGGGDRVANIPKSNGVSVWMHMDAHDTDISLSHKIMRHRTEHDQG